MGAFIAKQPNGLYCRFSTIVDCPTHWNMTEEDFIELCAEMAREEARFILQYRLRPFEQIKEFYHPHNMSESEFENCMLEMNSPQLKGEKHEI